MGSHWKWIYGGLLAACGAVTIVACTSQSSASTGDAPLMSSLTVVDSPATDSTIFPETAISQDPNQPAFKSQTEIEALQKRWKDAYEAERQLLLSKRLQLWLEDLYGLDDPNMPDVRAKLTDEQFEALSFKEKLAYQMYYPEDWSQNCKVFWSYGGIYQAIARELPQENTGYFYTERDEEALHKDTTAGRQVFLPDQAGFHWSERQLEALYRDTAEVKRIVLETMATTQTVSIPMMRTIVKFNVKAALLPLIDIYRKQTVKDDLILTTLMELMERLNFFDWIYSPLCKAIVVDENYTLPLTQANADEIISYAEKLAAKK
jgi:hypothetical protein